MPKGTKATPSGLPLAPTVTGEPGDEILPIVVKAGLKDERMAKACSARLRGHTLARSAEIGGLNSSQAVSDAMRRYGILDAFTPGDRASLIVNRATEITLECIAQTAENIAEGKLTPREVANVGERYMLAIERLVRASNDGIKPTDQVAQLLQRLHEQGGGSVTMSVEASRPEPRTVEAAENRSVAEHAGA